MTQVRNANKPVYDGIRFRSDLEKNVYRKLKEEGFNPSYESIRIHLIRMHHPDVDYYMGQGKSHTLKLQRVSTVRQMTYTPDVIVKRSGVFFMFEAKGFETPEWQNKRKLVIDYLERKSKDPEFPRICFFEVKNLKQLEQAIKIMNEYEND